MPPLGADLAGLIRTYRVDGPDPDLLDTDGHAQLAYGKGVFLVRPDGYLAFAGEDAGRLPAALRAVGLG
ncbi:hypothetical protein [Streptomyces sp. MST-110588]|uniref:aromatic-ring hydroxylase C-terminal domain-containing protein n=1 Tax=Streptomyces sp. MST-110588 TaxID=2833628 RepID=UPI003241C8D7